MFREGEEHQVRNAARQTVSILVFGLACIVDYILVVQCCDAGIYGVMKVIGG